MLRARRSSTLPSPLSSRPTYLDNLRLHPARAHPALSHTRTSSSRSDTCSSSGATYVRRLIHRSPPELTRANATQHVRAREAYEHVVQETPNHAKVLQQLGWLYHQDGSTFQNQELAIQYLTKRLEAGMLTFFR